MLCVAYVNLEFYINHDDDTDRKVAVVVGGGFPISVGIERRVCMISKG